MDNITSAKNSRTKKTRYNNLHMTPKDLRFATSDVVAEYRANRLKCHTILEIGCGIGLQTIAFAKTCKKVYAVELNERKLKLARLNIQQLNIKNVKFFHGDALKLVDNFKDINIIFCETEREPAATKRNLINLKPNPFEILQTYKDITNNVCVEVPAYTKSINLDCEKEYLSVNHNLNRLNLYFGNLKKCNTSVIALPSMARLEQTGKAGFNTKKLLKYLYEIDTAVVKAGLINELTTKNLLQYKNFLTSNFVIKNDFFKNRFKVLYHGKYLFNKLIRILKSKNFGKVVLRQKVDPKNYWQLRNKYESKLNGTKTAHLFVTSDETILCEKL